LLTFELSSIAEIYGIDFMKISFDLPTVQTLNKISYFYFKFYIPEVKSFLKEYEENKQIF